MITVRDLEWWRARLPGGHEIVLRNALEHEPIIVPSGGGLKLNIGSFTTMFHYGWLNIDAVDLENWALHNGYAFKRLDIRQVLPFKDGEVDLVFSSHCLEHLTKTEGENFLKECFRVMKRDAVLRISVPDTEKLTGYYREGALGKMDELNEGCASSDCQSNKLWSLLFSGHSSAYDYSSLSSIFKRVGFCDVRQSEFRRSQSQILRTETLDMFPDISLYIEAVR